MAKGGTSTSAGKPNGNVSPNTDKLSIALMGQEGANAMKTNRQYKDNDDQLSTLLLGQEGANKMRDTIKAPRPNSDKMTNAIMALQAKRSKEASLLAATPVTTAAPLATTTVEDDPISDNMRDYGVEDVGGTLNGYNNLVGDAANREKEMLTGSALFKSQLEHAKQRDAYDANRNPAGAALGGSGRTYETGQTALNFKQSDKGGK